MKASLRTHMKTKKILPSKVTIDHPLEKVAQIRVVIQTKTCRKSKKSYLKNSNNASET